MIKEFSLGNFRVFSELTTFKLKPLTIITGPNNSGKSSVNKALLLLKSSFSDSAKAMGYLFPQELIFDSDEHGLPGIEKTITFDSDSDELKFDLQIYSKVLQTPLNIELTYSVCSTGKSIYRNNLLSKLRIHVDDLDVITVLFKRSKSGFAAMNDSIWEAKYNHVKIYDYFASKVLARLINCKLDKENSNKNLKEEWPELAQFIEYLSSNNFRTQSNKKLKENLLFVDSLFDQINDLISKGTSFKEIATYLSNPFNKTNSEKAKVVDTALINDLLIKLVDENTQRISAEIILKTLSGFIDDSFSHRYNDIDTLYYSIYQTIEKSNAEFDKEFLEYFDKLLIANEIAESRISGLNQFLQFTSNLIPSIMDELYESLNEINLIPGIKLSNEPNSNSEFSKKILKDVFGLQEYLFILNQAKKAMLSDKGVEVNVTDKESEQKRDTDNSFYDKTEQGLLFVPKWLKEFNISDNYDIELDDYNHSLKLFLLDGDKRIPINQVGYGVAQLFFQILGMTFPDIMLPKSKIFILEEPESNLHPKFQSKLADMFVDAFKNLNRSFIIETHSEYMIRKLQYLVAKGVLDPNDMVIYYIDEPDPKKREPNTPQVREIQIDKTGMMSQDFGPGFFDEALNWKFELMKLKNLN